MTTGVLRNVSRSSYKSSAAYHKRVANNVMTSSLFVHDVCTFSIMKTGSRTIARSMIASVTRIPICIAYWSAHVSFAVEPKAQRVGSHWRLIATTLARPQRTLIPRTPCAAYSTFLCGLIVMMRRMTVALASVVARTSRMFEAK